MNINLVDIMLYS